MSHPAFTNSPFVSPYNNHTLLSFYIVYDFFLLEKQDDANVNARCVCVCVAGH